MAHKMTRRGSLDNVITYEHYCDTVADLNTIPETEINLGTIALVLKGTTGLEVYMADSNKNWIRIYGGSGSSDEGQGPIADETVLKE